MRIKGTSANIWDIEINLQSRNIPCSVTTPKVTYRGAPLWLTVTLTCRHLNFGYNIEKQNPKSPFLLTL